MEPVLELSLCMIVKNEEKVLAQSLGHIKNYVDEIVILDTGSTDDTIDIARAYTERVYQYKWGNNFAEARNVSLGYATKDWILVQDADEFIQNPSGIKSFLIQTSADCVAFTKINVFVDQKAITELSGIEKYPDAYYTSQEKLLRNHRGLKFTGAVHEIVVNESMNRPDIVSFPEKMVHLMDVGSRDFKRRFYNAVGKQALYAGDRNVNLLVRHLLYSLETENTQEFYELFDCFSGKLKYECRMDFLLPSFVKGLETIDPKYKERFLSWVCAGSRCTVKPFGPG